MSRGRKILQSFESLGPQSLPPWRYLTIIWLQRKNLGVLSIRDEILSQMKWKQNKKSKYFCLTWPIQTSQPFHHGPATCNIGHKCQIVGVVTMTMNMATMNMATMKMDKIKMATMIMDLVVLEGTLKLAPVAPGEDHVWRPAEYLHWGCHDYDHVDHVDHDEMITMRWSRCSSLSWCWQWPWGPPKESQGKKLHGTRSETRRSSTHQLIITMVGRDDDHLYNHDHNLGPSDHENVDAD